MKIFSSWQVEGHHKGAQRVKTSLDWDSRIDFVFEFIVGIKISKGKQLKEYFTFLRNLESQYIYKREPGRLVPLGSDKTNAWELFDL